MIFFQKHGIRYSEKRGIEDALTDLLTYTTKYIMVGKRDFRLSREIKGKINKHPKALAFVNLLEDAIKGNDLNPYQSDTLKQVRFHDHLLYNWHIYHLHLSIDFDSKNSYFKKRTNDLVFAYITRDVIFFLDFEQHKEGIFGDKKWLEIIDNNWPWLIKEHKRPDIPGVYPKINSIDRQTIWNKGYSLVMTEVNNSVFINPGLGSVSSGHSLKVVMKVDDIMLWLEDFKTWYAENEKEVITELSQKHNLPDNNISIKARLGMTHLEIYEENSGEIISTF